MFKSSALQTPARGSSERERVVFALAKMQITLARYALRVCDV